MSREVPQEDRVQAPASGLPPEASLVIPSRNRAELLVETVDSVLAGEEVPDEVIVVDQSDEPNGLLASRASDRCDLRYVWTEEIGVSRARNRGIRMARHPVLAFIDDDVRVHPSWFRYLLRAVVSSGPRAVISGRVLPEKPASRDGFVPSTIDGEVPLSYEGRIGRDILYSNNMALHRSVVEEVGGFDERLGGGAPFPTAEDNDFAHRLLESGYRIRYAPEAVVVHRAWRKGSDYLPLRWSYGRGQGAFYAKHLSLSDRYMLWRLFHDVGARVWRFFLFLVSDPRKAVGQAVYLVGLLSAAAQWLVTRPGPPASSRDS
jgi:GT2 family glycosyltransferase